MKRYFLHSLLLAVWIVLFASKPLWGQKGIDVPALSSIESDFTDWLDNTRYWKSATLAISKDGKLLYARSFGKIDQERTIDAQPHHLFRIASMSKSVTSIMVMKLIDDNLLSLTDTVFGPNGVLNHSYYYDGITVQDNRIYQITVKNLLEHCSGFGPTDLIHRHDDYASTGGLDPFLPEVAARLGEPNPLKIQSVVKFSISQPLVFTPGTANDYNNINFIILADIIEKRSGISFNNYLQSILQPLGIYDLMHDKSAKTEQHERSVEYLQDPNAEDKYVYSSSFYGDGALVSAPYGGESYEIISGAGAVTGTARDLVKLIASVDSTSSRSKILSPAIRDTMLRATAISDYSYAKGWGADVNGNFHHNGGGPGHISAWGYLVEGWAFAVVVIGAQGDGQDIEGDLKDIIRTRMVAITAPTHDLFLMPGDNSSNISVSIVSSSSATISWTKGSGSNRLVVVKAAGPVNQYPFDGDDYTANASLGSGANLGDGNYVVYNGTGNAVTVTSLTPGVVYHVRIIEYNKNINTGNHALYQLGGNALKYFSTSGTHTVTLTTVSTNGSIVQNISGTAHAYGSKVVLTAYANPGYMFAGWSGSVSETSNPVEVVMDMNKSVTANFVPYVPHHVLATWGYEGSIKISPQRVTHPHGTPVTLTAVAPQGYNFIQWEDGVGSSNPVSIVMDGPKRVVANWQGSASACYEAESVSGQTLFSPYQVLNDTLASGGQYITVTNGTGDLGSNPTSSIATYTFEAIYPNTYDVWLRVVTPTSSDNNISVRYDNNSFTNYNAPVHTSWAWVKALSRSLSAGTHTLSVARREDGVKIDKVFIAPSSAPAPVGLGCTVLAYTLTTSATNGVVQKIPDESTYDPGDVVQLTAKPAVGYKFIGWSGAVSGTTNPLNIMMSASKNVTANFLPLGDTIPQYTLATSVTGTGSVVLTPPSGVYNVGTEVTLTAKPGTGYGFDDWNGDASGAIHEVRLIVNGNKSVTANFVAATQHTLSTSVTGTGTVTLDPAGGIYNSGTTVKVTASPGLGYNFDDWSGDASGSSNPVYVTVNSNKSLIANFIPVSSCDTTIRLEVENLPALPGYSNLGNGTSGVSSGQFSGGSGKYANGSGLRASVATFTGDSCTYDVDIRWHDKSTSYSGLHRVVIRKGVNVMMDETWYSNKTSTGWYNQVYPNITLPNGASVELYAERYNSADPCITDYIEFTTTGLLRKAYKAVTEQKPKEFKATLFPNPTEQLINVAVDLPISSHLNISLIDARGVVLEILVSASCEEGHAVFTYDSKDLPAGIYTIVIISDNDVLYKNFIRQ